MASFGFIQRLFGKLGAEAVRIDVERTSLSYSTKVADVVQSLAAAAVSSPTTLWTATRHGLASPTAEFNLLLFCADPDAALGSDQDIDLELAYTDVGGSVTTKTFLVNRSAVFTMSNATVRGDITDARVTTAFITRVRVLNFTGNTTEVVRLLLLKT